VLIKNNTDPMGFAIVFQLLTAIIIGIFAVFFGFNIPNILPILPNFLLSIVIYTLANICVFQSLSKIEASQFTILFVTRGVWTIFTATLFLHEAFSLFNILGTVLILSSVILVSYKKNGLQFNKGSLYALGAGFLFGVGYVNDAYIVKFFSSPITYSFLDFLLPGFVLLILYRVSVIKHLPKIIKPAVAGKLLVLCFLYAIFGITILLSYKYGGTASQIGAISQSATVVIVLLAIVFLKETSGLAKKIFASLIAFIGVLLLR
jgi:drug/metabolite transporter (DMT)-like permease